MKHNKRSGKLYSPRAAKKHSCNARGNGQKLPDKASEEHVEEGNIFNFKDVPGYRDTEENRNGG